MTNEIVFIELPSIADLVPVTVARDGGKPDPKPYIVRAITTPKVNEAIKPHLFFKDKENYPGRHRVDAVRILDHVLDHDRKNGNAIAQMGISDGELIVQINVVIRRYYTIENHRAVGINPNWALKEAPATAE